MIKKLQISEIEARAINSRLDENTKSLHIL